MITHTYQVIQDYAAEFTSGETSLLTMISQATWKDCPGPQMISGHLQGRVLSMVSHMIKPRYILEVGTYTGYSALCLAEGLQLEGMLHTIDNNKILEERVRGYFEQSDKVGQLFYHIGEALDIIPTLDNGFDLAFIDADKKNNINYYDLILPKLKSGGFLLIDNVFWGGKVLNNMTKSLDLRTQIIVDLNRKVHNDQRVENVLFPIRDGLMVLRKK